VMRVRLYGFHFRLNDGALERSGMEDSRLQLMKSA
jgi:hypothetical protein